MTVGRKTDVDAEPSDRPRVVSDPEPVVLAPERGIDLWLLAAVLGLLAIGTACIYSSSAVYALKKHGDAAFFLKRQVVFIGLGGIAMWVAATTDYRWIRRWTYPLLAISFALLAIVLTFPTINGARRWIILGPMTFQPVEIAKLALIAFLAYSLSKKARRIKTFAVGFVPHLLIAGLMMGLLLLQPDLGSSIVLGATTLGLLFVAGARLYWIAVSVLAAAPMAYAMIVGSDWRMRRLMAYFNPEAYASSESYQIIQSGIAIGSGGTTGTGLGQGRQQLGYLPEGHSDFILSSIGEELGFAGIALLLCMFGVLVWRGVLAAMRARDSFGAYLCFGVILSVTFQAVFNMGVVLGVVPAKGITLPFVSYGGSSVIVSMFVLGVVLSIARAAPPAPAGRVLINAASAKRRRPRAVILVGR